jgi:hypothetical protein
VTLDPLDKRFLPLTFPKGIFKARRTTTRIVIHALDTLPSWRFDIREIDRWHREERGWKAIGYHFVTSREGVVVPGRPADVIGSHCVGWNSSSISIALAGGKLDKLILTNDPRGLYKMRDLYTEAQESVLFSLVNAMLRLWPAAQVVGHTDHPDTPKLCPGFDVAKWFAGNE